MSRFRILLITLVAVAGLLFTACGGDDDDVTTGDATDQTGDDAADSADSADESAAEDAMAAALGDGDCAFLAKFAGTGLSSFDPSTLFTSQEPVDLGEMFAPFAQEIGEVADAAPAEIADAFATMSDAFDSLVAELDGVVIDPTDPESMDEEAMAKLAALGDTFDNEELTAASEEINAWLETHCADLADAFDLSSLGG